MAAMKWLAQTEEQLTGIAGQILEQTNGRLKFAIQGGMGSGKTTLIKAFCKVLEIPEEQVSSPTFSLLNIYEGKTPVYHFDVYRIKDQEEMYDLGYEEYFFSNAFIFIEWPELIPQLISLDFVLIQIKEQKDGARLILLEESP